jgi:predicted GH43/DUF377 family glycosyl hydrolase
MFALCTVFSTTTGDLWVQTDQVDFDASEKTKVDTINDPGNVTLSKVWTKLPTDYVLDVGVPGSWDDILAKFPRVIHDGVTYHMWYTGNDGTNNRIGHATSSDGYQWTKDGANPVLDLGSPGSWDQSAVYFSSVIYNGSGFQMWFSGDNGSNIRIGYATSPDGVTWTRYAGNPVLDIGLPGSWDEKHVFHPEILYDGMTYHLWYNGQSGLEPEIGYASSPDGVTWTKYPGNPVLKIGPPGSWDSARVRDASVYHDGSVFHMWFSGADGPGGQIGHAVSSDGINWTKDPGNPVIVVGSPGRWDDFTIYTPSVLVEGSTYRMWFTGHSGSTWMIGYANSTDGHTWTKIPSVPVLDEGSPGSWDDDLVWTPSVVYEGGTYHMWYTGRDGAKNRIGYATSSDGITWSKYGGNPVLDLGPGGTWDDNELYTLSVIYNGSGFEMWYGGDDNPYVRIGYATSPDGMTWTKHPSNPVLDLGSGGLWDDTYVWYPSVIFDGGGYHMWYIGNDGSGNNAVGYATSADGIIWNRYASNPVFSNGSAGKWDGSLITSSNVYFDGDTYHLFYGGSDGSNTRIGHAVSTDGITWTRNPENPVLDVGPSGSWDDYRIHTPSVLHDGSSLRMWYTGNDGSMRNIGYAEFLYYQRGNITSSVFDSGVDGTVWSSITWTENLLIGTNITVATRSGDVQVPDGSWSSWSLEMWDETGLVIPSPRSRYIQYRATLYTSDRYVTPTLSEVNIDYSMNTAQAPVLSLPSNNTITMNTTPIFQWIFNDTEGDSQENYSVQINDNPLFTGVDYSSGSVTSILEEWTPGIPISDGIWFWRVRTMDEYGLWSNWSESWTITIDTIPPEPFIPTANPSLWTSDDRPSITFSTTDSLSGIDYYEVRVDSGSFSPQTSSYTLPSLSDGIHSITVRAYDNAGNYRDGTVDIYIDTTPPEAPTGVSAVPDSWTNTNSFEIDWTDPVESDTSGIATGAWYKIGSPPTTISDGTWLATKPTTVSSLEGEQTIYIWLEDNVGNVNHLNYGTTTLYLDTNPPEAPIDLTPTPSIWTNINSFAIQWTNPTDDSGVKIGTWYKIGSPPTSNSDGTWVSNKPSSVSSYESDQLIYVWLEDNLGNVDYNNHATTTLYLDTTPPGPPTGVTAFPNSWTTSNSFTLDWINPADDSGIKTGVWYKIDAPPSSESDGTWLITKPISITSLEGEHIVYIWLEDNVGNTNHLNYSTVSLFLDSIAPDITHLPVTEADPGKEITITTTVTDNVVVKVVRLHYRIQGDETFEIINMSNEGDVYTAVIPSSSVATKDIEYYISASDEINTATHPSSNAVSEPLPIVIEDDPEPCFISLWWLFLLLAIVLIIIFLLLALRRDEEEGGNGAITQEEPLSEHMGDTTTTGEEPTIPETGGYLAPTQGLVPPPPPPSMADDEIFEQIKQLYEKGELSEETFEDIKKRYGKS